MPERQNRLALLKCNSRRVRNGHGCLGPDDPCDYRALAVAAFAGEWLALVATMPAKYRRL